MMKLTQNHKIAISVASIFMVSLTVMLFLLSGSDPQMSHNVQANVSGHGGAATEGEAEHADPAFDVYKGYFKESGSMIFSLDSEGKFGYASFDFCLLLDKECKELEGKLFFDYVSTKDLADLASKHTKVVHDGKDVDGIGPYRLVRDHGKDEIFVMMNVHSILDEDGNVTEVVFSVKDITKKVEEMNEKSGAEPDNGLDDGKTSEAVDGEELQEDSGEGERPGDTRLMVDKISFNVHLLGELF